MNDKKVIITAGIGISLLGCSVVADIKGEPETADLLQDIAGECLNIATGQHPGVSSLSGQEIAQEWVSGKML